jgi:hypothetical protein
MRPVPNGSLAFVPLDIAAPVLECAVDARAERSADAAARALSDRLRRDVDVVLAGRGVDWGRVGGRPLAFEAPPGAALLPCVVRAVAGARLVPVGPPFLVAVPAGPLDRDSLRAEVERRLAPIWAGGEVTGDAEGEVKFDASIEFADGARTAVFVTEQEPYTVDALLRGVEAVAPKWGRVCAEVGTVLLRPGGGGANLELLRRRELPAPRAGPGLTLADCLEFHSEPEKLSEDDPWICEQCNEICFPEKKVDIWSLPEVVIVHLKRFAGSGFDLRKLEDYVDYPNEIDFRKYVIGPQRDSEMKYRLYAVSHHSGGVGGGHYYANAIVQDPRNEPEQDAPWFLFDDSFASPSSRDCHSASGYLLFYEKLSK